MKTLRLQIQPPVQIEAVFRPILAMGAIIHDFEDDGMPAHFPHKINKIRPSAPILHFIFRMQFMKMSHERPPDLLCKQAIAISVPPSQGILPFPLPPGQMMADPLVMFSLKTQNLSPHAQDLRFVLFRTHKTLGLYYPYAQDLRRAFSDVTRFAACPLSAPLAFSKKTPGPLLPFRKKVPGVLRHITCLSYSNLCQGDDQAFWHMFSSNEELCVIFHTKCISKPLDFDFLYEISYKNVC